MKAQPADFAAALEATEAVSGDDGHGTPAGLPGAVPASAVGMGVPWMAAAAAVCILCLSVWGLWPEWQINPQYEFAKFLPFLVPLLLWYRWEDVPKAHPPAGLAAALGLGLVVGCTLFLAAARPVLEANPDWKTPGAIGLAMGTTGLMALAFLSGGFPWLWHFSPVIALLLLGIPWPKPVEDFVMRGLIQFNAAIAVEMMHWAGYAAERTGNLVRLDTGIVGIDEACSGIRSLQASIASALVAGEFFRLGLRPRMMLLAAGLTAAGIGNLARTTTLCFVSAEHGTEAADLWHDSAGYTILAVTTLIIAVLAWWFSRRHPAAARSEATDRSPAWVALGGLKRHRTVFAGAVVLLLGSVGATEAWYRWHEAREDEVLRWGLQSLGAERGGVPREVDERTMAVLRHPQGHAESWRGDTVPEWASYYFYWSPGRIAAQAAWAHHPTVCLGGAGHRLVKRVGVYEYRRTPFAMDFDVYLFDSNAGPFVVYHAIIEEGRTTNPSTGGLTLAGRFRVVAEGRRNRGQRLLEFFAMGTHDEPAARNELRRTLDERVRLLP